MDCVSPLPDYLSHTILIQFVGKARASASLMVMKLPSTYAAWKAGVSIWVCLFYCSRISQPLRRIHATW